MATMLTKASSRDSLSAEPNPETDKLQQHRQGSAHRDPLQVLDPGAIEMELKGREKDLSLSELLCSLAWPRHSPGKDVDFHSPASKISSVSVSATPAFHTSLGKPLHVR